MSSTFGTPNFGAPSTSQPATQTNGLAQPQPSDAQQPIVDENDPRLVSEILEVNPAGDSFASPPPPPDGPYRVKLKLEGFSDPQGQKRDYGPTMTKGGGGNPTLPYFTTGISASIIDPSGKHDGIVVYPPFGGNVGSLIDRQGSSKISTILFKLRRPDGQSWGANFQGNQKGWMERFVEAMKSEPECGVLLQWEWNCQACGEEAKAQNKRYPRGVQGMGHFPLEADKTKAKAQGHNYSPEMKCPANAAHGYSRGRAVISRFLSLEELAEALKIGVVR